MSLTITTIELERLENVFTAFRELNNCETFWTITRSDTTASVAVVLPFSCSVSAGEFFYQCAKSAWLDCFTFEWGLHEGDTFALTFTLQPEAPAELPMPAHTARTKKVAREWESVWQQFCRYYPRRAQGLAEVVEKGLRSPLRHTDILNMQSSLKVEIPFLSDFGIYGKDIFIEAHKIMDRAIFPERTTKALREMLRLYGMPNESPHALEGWWEREMARPGARDYYDIFTRSRYEY